MRAYLVQAFQQRKGAYKHPYIYTLGQVVININKRTGEEFPLKNIHYCMPPPKFLYGTRTYTTIKLKYDVSSVLNVVFNENRAKFNP